MSDTFVKQLWKRIEISALIRFLLLLACGWGVLQFFAYFESIIAIFAFAAIIAFLLSYPVRWLNRFLPYGVAASLVFLLSLALAVILAATIGLRLLSQGQQLIDNIIASLNSLSPLFVQIETALRERDLPVNLNLVRETIREQILTGIGYVLANLQSFLTNLLTLIIIAVVAFFMLLDGKRLWNFLLKVLPKERRQRFTGIVKRNFLGFFRGQLLLCLFLTTSTFIVFIILQVPFPLLLSLVAGVFDLIPGIGATLGVGSITLILLSQNVWLALKVLAACIVLQQIQDNLIAPRIMQNTVQISPVIVFFALLVGARIAGILGIFLAIPIAGVIVSWLEIDEIKADSST
ncbi:MAG: AI-2E family transporter [Cyanosarcina radialis HA8281-LM2]|jgi:predicted PurR-regulated permease PerM|nr:AI-2E family transporter [Cyanosarcina radialis HA8281-LM2]